MAKLHFDFAAYQAVLEFQGGDRASLAAHIRQHGLAPGSSEARFVADVLEGKWRRTKGHANYLRKMDALSLLSAARYRYFRQKQLPVSERSFATLDDAYEWTAKHVRPRTSVDALKQLEKRHRREQRAARAVADGE